MPLLNFMLRVVLLLVLIWLLHRIWVYLTGSIKDGEALPPRPEEGTVPMVLDPQCGLRIPEYDALTATVHGKIIHFCSRECRDAYLSRQPPG